MMKALYSGVSGMRSHQTKMDVIGNNIANVNTNGYKTQRATFRDIYYQQLQTPGAATANTIGGTNASQVGYGAQVDSVDTIHTLTGYSPTNKGTDIYINGDGYFMVKDNSDNTYFTRYGAMHFDSSGNLVDSNGSRVFGLKKGATATDGKIEDTSTDFGAININLDHYKNITINRDGTITGVAMEDAAEDNDTIVTLAQIAIAYVPNQNALVAEGSSYYSESVDSGTITYNVPGLNATGPLITGALEMSNVDLANEFSDMIITQRGFQANTKIISVVDQMLEELVNLKR